MPNDWSIRRFVDQFGILVSKSLQAEYWVALELILRDATVCNLQCLYKGSIAYVHLLHHGHREHNHIRAMLTQSSNTSEDGNRNTNLYRH